MNFWLKNLRGLRNQYVVFFCTITLTIIGTQYVIQRDLNLQNEDARLINISGRQRMLSQRIAKLVLYIQKDIRDGKVQQARLDTLKKQVSQWKKVHFGLLQGDKAFLVSDLKSPAIDSLLTHITPLLTAIADAALALAATPDVATASHTVAIIEQHELNFLSLMEETVATYQHEAEKKLKDLKMVALALAAAAIIIVLLELIYIFAPMTRRLGATNQKLTSLNAELGAINEELQASEEEVRSNLDFVSALKEQLQVRERQFREVVENATDMIYELDEHGKFAYANPVMEAITQYSKAELNNMVYWDILHPDHKARVVEFYQNQMRNQLENTYLEFPICTKNREEVWVGQNVRMFFQDNWVLKVSVVARDITGLYSAQKAVQKSESLFRSLTENSPAGIYQLDPLGAITFVNKKWFEILGIDNRNITPEQGQEYIYHEDRPKVLQAWNEAIHTGCKFAMEFRYETPAKGTIWVTNNLNPVVNEKGQVTGFIGTVSDITPAKQAQQKAEEATHAKSQFLSMMSHEIRTPMNAIIGITNLMLLEKPRPDQLENLKLLKFSGENLLTIINDILDFSKIEAGKIVLEHIDFNLESSLTNIQQMLQQRADEKGIKLYLRYSELVPAIVKGDPVRIGQVVTNLLGNAIKFTEQGYVELSVTPVKNNGNKHKLRFAVKDTGIGIDSESIKRIFESFSQASSETTRKFGGTGLGLSITKRLLQLMGSSISVESTPGHGATFTFELELEEGSREAANAEEKLLLANDFNAGKVKVLLVEDNRVNQIVASNFLRKWGIEVDFANNGKEAVEMIESKLYNIVLMDLQMPEMDGYEATRRIRRLDHDPYFKKVPIIALTASAMNDIKEKVLKIGMTDFITKPFLPEDLQSKIGKYIAMKAVETVPNQKRQINLDLYTEGDPEFKRELAALLIKNIEELQGALTNSIELNDAEIYRKTSHKVKPTIGMLGDNEYSAIVDEIKEMILSNPASPALDGRIKNFHDFSEKLIEGLKEEIER
jgi:PAS domain S-box-containing protein